MKAPVSLTSFRPQKSLAIAIGVLAVVVLPFLSYYTVNEGERGILLRYGKIVKVAEPGLGFKIPFMESVEKISTRNQAVVYQGLQAYSRDQQPAQMTVSVSFHIKPSEAGAVYTTYNTIEALKDRLIVRQLPLNWRTFSANIPPSARYRIVQNWFRICKMPCAKPLLGQW